MLQWRERTEKKKITLTDGVMDSNFMNSDMNANGASSNTNNSAGKDADAESIDHLRKQLEARDRQLHTVHRISAALSSQSDIRSILRQTLLVCLETVDADAGSLLLYNPDKRRLVFEYVVGKTDLLGREIDPETDLVGKAATVFRSGEPLMTVDTYKENYNRDFDNSLGYVTHSIVTIPLKNFGGTPLGVLQALNKRHGQFDASDIELLEIVSSLAATSIMNARLAQEAQLAAVARALGDLSHDIKNALTPIETMVDTTIDSFVEPMYTELDTLMPLWKAESPNVAEAVEQITAPLQNWYPEVKSSVKDGCADIRELVSEITDYLKGTQSTHIVENSLSDLLEERLRRLKVLAQQRNVVLTMEDLDTVPPFGFDQRLLSRAVFNLVNNALAAINDAVRRKQMAYRKFHIRVKATARSEGTFPDGNYCLLEVDDDGPGMPPHVRESLFTPHAISTTIGGTGIGTRFVKSVADAHGGTVGVESVLGSGARFWMKFPLHRS